MDKRMAGNAVIMGDAILRATEAMLKSLPVEPPLAGEEPAQPAQTMASQIPPVPTPETPEVSNGLSDALTRSPD